MGLFPCSGCSMTQPGGATVLGYNVHILTDVVMLDLRHSQEALQAPSWCISLRALLETYPGVETFIMLQAILAATTCSFKLPVHQLRLLTLGRYVDQGGGKRKGAFAVYLEPWHADIFDWLNLRKNHGKEEVRSMQGQMLNFNTCPLREFYP